MLVVNRFRVSGGTTSGSVEAGFRADLQAAHEALAQQRGYVDGWVARNLDDAELWVLATRWESVGAYRRALSSYDVKLHAVPTLSRALDEPSAYEVVDPGSVLNVHDARVT